MVVSVGRLFLEEEARAFADKVRAAREKAAAAADEAAQAMKRATCLNQIICTVMIMIHIIYIYEMYV